MKGLLIKDFRLMLGQTRFLITVVVIMAVLGFTMNANFMVGYAGIMGGMFALTTLSYDEADNGYSFLFTLPICRKSYVREKYVLLPLVAVVFAVLPAGVLEVLRSGDAAWKAELGERWAGYIGFLVGFLLMMAIMVPLQLKYGVEKSKTVMLLVYGGIVVIVFLGSKLSHTPGAKLIVDKCAEILQQIGIVTAGVIGVVLALALYLISLFVSTRIMLKKEF